MATTSYKNPLTILLILCFSVVDGQKIDSLKALLSGKTGLDRYNILYALAYEYVDIHNGTALGYAKIAFREAKQKGDSLRIVQSGRILSLAFRGLGEIDSSIMVSDEILPIANRNDYVPELKLLLNGLALGYTFKASYDKALNYYFQSMDLKPDEEHMHSNWYILNNIGLVYYKMKDYNKALSYYNQALRIQGEFGDKYTLSSILINVSLCNAHLKNFEEAKGIINMAMNSCKPDCSQLLLLQIKYCLGVIYYLLNDVLKAEPYFLESYSIANEIKNKRFQLDNIVYLSQVYIKLNRLNVAERYLMETEKLIGSGIPYNLELIKVYRELYAFNDKSGNYKKASQYLHKYAQLKDSIYNEELTTNLMKAEADFLERENRQKLEVKDKLLALNNEIIFRQKIVNLSIGVALALLAVLGLVLIRNNRHKKIMNRLLEQKVKDRTIALVQNESLLVKSLDERARQVQKLSDDVMSSLATIRGLCSVGLMDSNGEHSIQYLNRIQNASDKLLEILPKPSEY